MPHRDSPAHGEHTFRPQEGKLFVGELGCGAAVGPKHPVPRQVMAVFGEDSAHQAGPSRQPGSRGDFPVGHHPAWRYGDHHVADAFDCLLIHRWLRTVAELARSGGDEEVGAVTSRLYQRTTSLPPRVPLPLTRSNLMVLVTPARSVLMFVILWTESIMQNPS